MKLKAGILTLVAVLVVLTAVNLTTQSGKEDFKQFASDEEFKEYLSQGSAISYPAFRMTLATPVLADVAVEKSAIERYSLTNVQVAGIDEPDIVKTDGRNIYFSSWQPLRPFVPLYGKGKTLVISAFPPENLSVSAEIDAVGELLLYGDVLIVVREDVLKAYSISDQSKLWSVEVNGSIVSARLYGDRIYVVARSFASCPVIPLRHDNGKLVVRCTDIYHPTIPVSVDSTYTVAALDAKTGEIVDSMSFVGSTNSVVYMSPNAIYVSYTVFADPAEFFYGFVETNSDLFPRWVVERIEKLLKYDISGRAKAVEIQTILESYASSLSEDERLKFENEMWNRMREYMREHGRELEQTKIVKISLDLDPIAYGSIPGRLLNQFSMDEYDGYLRVATNIGRADTNDLYVLDADLKVIGSIKDFGKGERIYAVRFIGERGYVVTFRETDPFFVIDLSNPENPKIAGELKIPGFSSYLHPLSDNLILGIGRDGWSVKVSLFDVSNAENPQEVDRFVLKEQWSEVLYNHHAFLLDKKHRIFFLPAGKAGYVFSYENGLKIETVTSVAAVRAVYINDYLYILGRDRIVVFDEFSWEKVGELEL